MIPRGFRGWEIEYKDGTTVHEGQIEWKDAPKQGIKCLSLHYDGREWHICDKPEYYQKKRASVIPSIPGSFRIESRSIGYYENNNVVLYTVDEHTGRMKLEVKEIN